MYEQVESGATKMERADDASVAKERANATICKIP